MLSYGRGLVRMSSVLNQLRSHGGHAAADQVERDAKVAAVCNTHGAIVDPIIGIIGDRVAFACPQCSSVEAKQAYDEELP